MSSLLELTREIEDLCEVIDKCPDEIPQTLIEHFGGIKLAHKDKIDAVSRFDAALDSNIEHYKKLRDKFSAKVKTLTGIQERFYDYLKFVLAEAKVPLIGNESKIVMQKNAAPKLVIDLNLQKYSTDAAIIILPHEAGRFDELVGAAGSPYEFCDPVRVYALNKDKIKEHLKRGHHLEWAHLEQGEHVRIK